VGGRKLERSTKINHHVTLHIKPNNPYLDQDRWLRCSFSYHSTMSHKKQDAKKKQEKEYGTISDVPEGMTTRRGLNGQEVLVPQYMLPGMDHAFAAFRQKTDLGVTKAKPEVSPSIRAVPCRRGRWILAPWHGFRLNVAVRFRPYSWVLTFDRWPRSRTRITSTLEGK